MSDFDDLAHFCARLLGSDEKAPLKDANGALASALLDSYLKIRRIGSEKGASRRHQEFEDQIYREPWAVYSIRNSETGCAYIGLAENGFISRYPNGEWWIHTHNQRLRRDSVAFGVLSFSVAIWPCSDRAEMLTKESELIRAHRLCTYNLREEPANAANMHEKG